MTIALVGPPNVGKTTLFNHMTGENADIGTGPALPSIHWSENRFLSAVLKSPTCRASIL